ncbi:MAG: hypothetical protein Q8P62_04885 [Candidatus Peregrinibacteria bacterium]|nr:hypothetical protein [Candidatus Peregrinibacteria bacterium]
MPRMGQEAYYKIRNCAVLCVVVLNVLCSGTAAYAEDKTDLKPTEGGNFAPAKCLAKGNLDFVTFLRASIFADGLAGGVMELWYDVLYRNKCQTADISSLVNQRDKMRTYIRDAFLTCNTAKLPNLKRGYNELGAELYYVRNLVNKKIAANLPYDILSTRMAQNPDELFYPREKLYAEMKEKYQVSGVMSSQDFEKMFAKFETKYMTRKTSYIICENSAWEGVSKKWNEFLSTLFGIAPAVKSIKKETVQNAERIVESATNQSLTAYLSGIVAVNINKLDAKEGTRRIVDRLVQSAPKGRGVTAEDVTDAIAETDKAYDIDLLRQELSSQFYVNYKEVSDSSTAIFMQSLSNLNASLKDSLTPLSNLLGCTKIVNSKQCPATE